MSWIQPVTYETASAEVKALLDEKGRDMLEHSVKTPYQLRNFVVYDAIERNAWRMDAEVQRLVGKRYGDLMEYIVSKENQAEVCVRYYRQCLLEQGIDPDGDGFDEKERAVIAFGQAIVRDRGTISAELKASLKKHFSEEQITVLAGIGIITNSDNLYDRIFEL